jgi:hypothetical protein
LYREHDRRVSLNEQVETCSYMLLNVHNGLSPRTYLSNPIDNSLFACDKLYPMTCNEWTATPFNIVAHLLKARTVEPEKQLLLANGYETTFVST